jgi:hypothetical protein
MTVIAMTREIGSHGLDVSSAIARELGLRVVNSEIVASRVASNLGIKESAVQRYLQGAASLLERWQIDKRELSRLTAEEIFGLAQQGDVLIRGWGVSALFRDVPQERSIFGPRLREDSLRIGAGSTLPGRIGDADGDRRQVAGLASPINA